MQVIVSHFPLFFTLFDLFFKFKIKNLCFLVNQKNRLSIIHRSELLLAYFFQIEKKMKRRFDFSTSSKGGSNDILTELNTEKDRYRQVCKVDN